MGLVSNELWFFFSLVVVGGCVGFMASGLWVFYFIYLLFIFSGGD